MGQFCQKPEIAWRLVDGQAVLVSPERGCVFVLNELGTQIWRALEDPSTTHRLVESVARSGPPAEDRLFTDVESFLEELESRSLIEASG